MGYTTKIDWCDSSWNPVTGCLHSCEYCYARGIAQRFGGHSISNSRYKARLDAMGDPHIYEFDEPAMKHDNDGKLVHAPYPVRFLPTLHRYRLDQPSKWSEPRTIFVCSMADLFGEWVPDDWIKDVIHACLAAPQHRYLFLTKNPARYIDLIKSGVIPENQENFWLGSTATSPEAEFFWSNKANTFVSIEPILAPFENMADEGQNPTSFVNWIIIGAETGNRKDKVTPKASWIMDIVQNAEKAGTPIFMKESLREIMGDCFRQEFPWEE